MRLRECSLKNAACHKDVAEANFPRDMTLIRNGDGIAWRAKPWKLIAVPGGLPSPVSPVLSMQLASAHGCADARSGSNTAEMLPSIEYTKHTHRKEGITPVAIQVLHIMRCCPEPVKSHREERFSRLVMSIPAHLRRSLHLHRRCNRHCRCHRNCWLVTHDLSHRGRERASDLDWCRSLYLSLGIRDIRDGFELVRWSVECHHLIAVLNASSFIASFSNERVSGTTALSSIGK